MSTRLHRSRKQSLQGFPVILSVTDKSGLEQFIPLWKAGAELISTGGTLTALRKLGMTVTPVEEITGAKPKFGGRIKTLDEILFSMLLARLDVPQDMRELKNMGLCRMGLVVMNPYNFEAKVSEPDVRVSDIIECIDIGGGALPLAAIKAGVPVAMYPGRYGEIVRLLLEGNGLLPEEYRDGLNLDAMVKISAYYSSISIWMAGRFTNAPLYREWEELPLGVSSARQESAGGSDDS